MKQPSGQPPEGQPGAGGLPRRKIAIGILMLARGQSAGLRHFGGTRQSVQAALAPLAAFILVALVLAVLAGASAEAVSDLMSLAIGFLGQLVLSFEVARRWGRASEWFHFATAFCWCQWAGPLAMAVFLVIMALLVAAGLPSAATAVAGMVGLFAYGVWLHWFLARTALRLSALRAVGLVIIVNLMTSMLVFVPQWIANRG